ncbi:MAG: ABC transporter permease, partial [Deltaproteobacteria bacterium]|nr:ABC transporter permease [Deltaproteobacteria bacterium]
LFYRDVKYIFEVAILLWMFVTSVVYPVRVPSQLLQFLLNLNPMTPIINAYRSLLLKGELPELAPLAVAAAFSVSLLIAAWTWFDRAEFLFAERI